MSRRVRENVQALWVRPRSRTSAASDPGRPSAPECFLCPYEMSREEVGAYLESQAHLSGSQLELRRGRIQNRDVGCALWGG
jgi:hypothetical protein